jgi:hypothetical protein
MQCPDRHAKGGSKGKFKSGKGAFGKTGGWSKGKGKSSKGKGKAYFLDLACILSAHWDASSVHGRAPTRAIIDTGASENAIGVDCLHDLVNAGGFNYEVCLEDLPTFRFGMDIETKQSAEQTSLAPLLDPFHFMSWVVWPKALLL